MELLHQQGQFLLYCNGVQYVPFADPVLFTLGYAFPGLSLLLNQQVQLTQFAFEVPSSDTLGGNGLDPSGKVVTTIAGTRVLFDGVAAPMIYTVKNQVSAVVPYEIAGQAATQVQVEYNGIRPVAVTVPVLPAVPGILTANASGSGQAVAVNQDGSLNSASNPAARGSVAILYATGEGQRNSAGVTGVPAPAYGGPVLSPAALTVEGRSGNPRLRGFRSRVCRPHANQSDRPGRGPNRRHRAGSSDDLDRTESVRSHDCGQVVTLSGVRVKEEGPCVAGQ